MKKVLIAFTLGLVLFCATALPALAQSKPSQYMSLCMMYKGIKSAMYVLYPDGTKEEVRMKSIANGFGVSFDKIADIQVDVLTKLNELKAKGWEIDQVSTISNEGFIITSYILKKED